MYLFALHIPEEYVGAHRFRHKVGGAHQLRQGPGGILLGVEQKIPGVEDAYDVVRVLPVHGETGPPGGKDGVQYLFAGVLEPHHHHVGAVDHHVLGGGVVEFEDVLDEFLFGGLDGPPLLAQIHHHADLVLAHILLVGPGVDAEQAQYAVGGFGQQPDHRAEYRGHGGHGPGGKPGHRLRLFHGDALGDQLPQHQAEVGQHNGDEHHHQVVEGVGFQGGDAPLLHQPLYQRIGKAVGGKGGGQEARQGDGDLDGGQEIVRGLGELEQLFRLFVPLLGLLSQLGLGQGDDGDLRRGEKGVDEDEDGQ